MDDGLREFTPIMPWSVASEHATRLPYATHLPQEQNAMGSLPNIGFFRVALLLGIPPELISGYSRLEGF